jgi:ubiquinone/menaquinone biosynthesis C-methylase UbiE
MSETEMSTEDWIVFLKKQADHTREFRHSLYERVDIKRRKRILDVGCGSGVITAEIASLTGGDVIGVDIDSQKLAYAKLITPRITVMEADALYLPFRDNTFDLVMFSVVLMHIKEQQKAVNEMARVTRKNGIVLATMEPDHAGALHYPESRSHPLFMKNLEEKGSDTHMGRKLKYIFTSAGLKTEIGITTHDMDMMNRNSNEFLEHFLHYFEFTKKSLRKYNWTEDEIETYKQDYVYLIENNLWFSFMPIFYAIGRKY